MEFEIYFFNKNELCTNYLVRQLLFVYSEKNESEIKGIEVEIIMVEGENTTKLKYNSLKTNKVSALLFLK